MTSPLGPDTAALVQSLSGTLAGAGTTAALTQDMLRTDMFYAPSAADFRAIALNQAASSLATQKALAELALKSSAQRLTYLTDLRNRLGNSPDVKAAADATARLAGEQATAQAQGNQLLAVQVMQQAQQATTQAREQQAWRCSAEDLVAQAKAAAADGRQRHGDAGEPEHADRLPCRCVGAAGVFRAAQQYAGHTDDFAGAPRTMEPRSARCWPNHGGRRRPTTRRRWASIRPPWRRPASLRATAAPTSAGPGRSAARSR